MNTQTLEDRMMLMKPHELQQFAAMHKNDPYVLPLAMKISDMRKKLTVAQGMQYAGQKQPTVADQAIASINPQQAPQQAAPQQALPENQGIGPLAAPNIQGMADGGIAGYASGKATFDPDAYLNNPNVQKYLAYINAYEGKPKENHLVGYKTFDDLSDHPNQRVRFGKSKNQVSTAAGSYQILKRSWDDQKKKLGLNDFSLENQQRAAIGLLKEHGALQDVVKGNFQKANEKAKNIWASLPGSTIGEATGQRARVKPELEAALNRKDGIERLAAAPAEKQAAPVQPRRVAQREEKFGLDPKLAQFFNNFLPGGEAFAGELPQSQAPVKAPTNLSVPPSNGTRGITQLPTNLVEPTKPLPANLLQPAAAPAKGKGKAALVEEYSDPMGNIISVPQDAPQAQSGTKRPVASTIASLFDVVPNAFTGTAGEITRAISRPFLSSDEATKQVRGAAETFADPAARILGVRDDPAYRRGPVNAALNQVSEGIDYVGGNVSDVTGIPKDDVTNAINLSPLGLARARSAIKKGGVDYNVPQKAKAGDAGLAMLAERSKQASAEAAAARAKTAPRADTQQIPLAAETPRQGELFPREPVPVQGELFPETVPQPKPLKPGEFPIHPDTLAMQERIAQVRGEQSKVAAGLAERRAKEAAAAEAKYRAELEAPKPKSALDKVINAADKVPVQGTLGAAQQGQNRPVEKRPYEAFEENFTAPETNYKLPAPEDLTKKEKKDVISDVKASPEGKEVKKAGMDFSDKDWLNLGLNLLSAKSEGQYGVSGFLSNLGTAGKETLAQKQEREKIEAAKAFQDIQGKYYAGITENLGKPQGEERLIARMADEQKIPFSDAAEQYYGMKQTDRTNMAGLVTAYNQAKLLDPSAAGMTFHQWAKANGIPLSQTQQTAIDPAVMDIYNRVMKKGG